MLGTVQPDSPNLTNTEVTDFVIDQLNDALATELLCMVRENASGRVVTDTGPLYEQDAGHRETAKLWRTLERSRRIKTRILELGGEAICEPQTLFGLSTPEWGSLSRLVGMLCGFDDAEADCDRRLREVIARIGDMDVDSCRMLEGVACERGMDKRIAMQGSSRAH